MDKEYTTKEALIELIDNPKFMFKSTRSDLIMRVTDSGCICMQTSVKAKVSKMFININTTWTKVQQSVSREEAINAFHEGKSIRCEFENSTYIYRPKNGSASSHYGFQLKDTDNGPITSGELLYGAWYIE